MTRVRKHTRHGFVCACLWFTAFEASDGARAAPYSEPVTPDTLRWGRALFFDVRLSKGGKTSCATCHDPARAFTDGLRLAQGERPGMRNTPTLLAATASPWTGYSGDTPSLAARALRALTSAHEHGLDLTRLERVLLHIDPRKGGSAGAPLVPRAAQALGAYVATLRPPATRFDQGRLTSEERRGEALFLGRAGCVRCHFGPLFTSGEFHNIGTVDPRERASPDAAVPFALDASEGGLGTQDAGPRKEALAGALAGVPLGELVGALKVPTLRQLAHTAPYFHDGRAATLAEVVDHYDRAPAALRGRSDVRPLGLTASEKGALVAFLLALSSGPGAQTFTEGNPFETAFLPSAALASPGRALETRPSDLSFSREVVSVKETVRLRLRSFPEGGVRAGRPTLFRLECLDGPCDALTKRGVVQQVDFEMPEHGHGLSGASGAARFVAAAEGRPKAPASAGGSGAPARHVGLALGTTSVRLHMPGWWRVTFVWLLDGQAIDVATFHLDVLP